MENTPAEKTYRKLIENNILGGNGHILNALSETPNINISIIVKGMSYKYKTTYIARELCRAHYGISEIKRALGDHLSLTEWYMVVRNAYYPGYNDNDAKRRLLEIRAMDLEGNVHPDIEESLAFGIIDYIYLWSLFFDQRTACQMLREREYTIEQIIYGLRDYKSVFDYKMSALCYEMIFNEHKDNYSPEIVELMKMAFIIDSDGEFYHEKIKNIVSHTSSFIPKQNQVNFFAQTVSHTFPRNDVGSELAKMGFSEKEIDTVRSTL